MVENVVSTAWNMSEDILFALDQNGPLWHDVLAGGEAVLRGWILSADDRVIGTLAVRHQGRTIAACRVDLPSPDIGLHLPGLRSASHCRFELRCRCPAREPIEFEVAYANGESGGRAVFPPHWIASDVERIAQLAGRLATLPLPDAERVALTQGVADVRAYRNSTLTSVAHMLRYLALAGATRERIRCVVDVGCGTGRVLTGWYIDDPTRHLRGYDINPVLIDWASRSLPQPMSFSVNQLSPPLAEESGSFDLAYLISVFTHLSPEIQMGWVEEFHRLLKPGGILLLTLQGDIYVRLMQPHLWDAYSKHGHVEVTSAAEGSNAYGSFHSRTYAEKLMKNFRLLRCFPRGGESGEPAFFPLAAFQDVYVFQRL